MIKSNLTTSQNLPTISYLKIPQFKLKINMHNWMQQKTILTYVNQAYIKVHV